MSAEVYVKSMSYEIFMCRAFKTSDRSKPGLDISYMKNLIDSENGESHVSHLPSFIKQLESIKKHMDKALDKLIARRRTEVKQLPLYNLQIRTRNAKTSNDLLAIIEEALSLTQDIKGY